MNTEFYKDKSILIIGGNNKVLQLAVKGFLAYGAKKIVILNLLETFDDKFKHPENVEICYGDIHDLSTKEFSTYMNGIDYLVVASSKTAKRKLTNVDIEQYYYQRNIEDTDNILRIAKLNGIKNVLIIGSHLSTLDKMHKRTNFSYHHPYIYSRTMQEQLALENNTSRLSVTVLELPFVLGRNFQLTEFFDIIAYQIFDNKSVYSIKGIGNFCTVEEAAQAIVNSFMFCECGKIYTLVTHNLRWKEIIMHSKFYVGNTRKIKNLSSYKLGKLLKQIKKNDNRNKLKCGIDFTYYREILLNKQCMDTSSTVELLQIQTSKDWKQALYKTIEHIRDYYENDNK